MSNGSFDFKDAVRAALDGKRLQYELNGHWFDLEESDPEFSDDENLQYTLSRIVARGGVKVYRIKPEPETYWMAISKDAGGDPLLSVWRDRSKAATEVASAEAPRNLLRLDLNPETYDVTLTKEKL